MSGGCTSAHTFHDALVDSELVSQPTHKYGYCSTVSVQSAAAGRSVQLGLGSLVAGVTVRARPVQSCPSGAGVCESLCSSAISLQISPAVAFWNRLFRQFRLLPEGVSASGCTEVIIVPAIRWEVGANGMLLSLYGTLAMLTFSC